MDYITVLNCNFPQKFYQSDLLQMKDLNKSEIFILSILALPTLFFGVYPELLFNTIEISVRDLIEMYQFNLSSNSQLINNG